MCYSGYKGTIKRAKKQMKFDFSEREYLRDVFPKVRLTPNRSLAHNSPVIVPAIALSSILFPCIKARACLVFVQVVMSQDQGIWIFLLKVLYKQQQYPEHLLSKQPLKFYQENPANIQDDYHTAYYGEIVASYVLEG